MKLITFGVFIFALSFCGIADRLKDLTGKTSTNTAANTTAANTASNTTRSNTSSSNTGASTDSGKAEKPTLTGDQQAIADSGQETKWDDQGMSWKLPKDWKKMNQTKESFNYSSPDNAFLLVNISPMGDNFPVETSLKAYYESAIQQIKNGKYESARYVEIDGVKGVEFVEAMPEDKSGARRHQWLAYRNYLGQTQMLNVMLSTKGSNFEKHNNDFPAILYSMKIQK